MSWICLLKEMKLSAKRYSVPIFIFHTVQCIVLCCICQNDLLVIFFLVFICSTWIKLYFNIHSYSTTSFSANRLLTFSQVQPKVVMDKYNPKFQVITINHFWDRKSLEHEYYYFIHSQAFPCLWSFQFQIRMKQKYVRRLFYFRFLTVSSSSVELSHYQIRISMAQTTNNSPLS